MRSGSPASGPDHETASAQAQERERNPGPGTGWLAAVGLGPGDEEHLTPEARETLERADCIVGYTTYVRLLSADLLGDKEVVSTGMTGEIERCRTAVERARAGSNVAVVCSGDPGVYALAGLLLEILQESGSLDTVPFRVIPGIPAFCAAAALMGAPLMHDFAVVSLSDLLTPWETIERRVQAALEADFVLALYNPRSKKRSWQLPRVLEIYRVGGAGGRPAGWVKSAAREGQAVRLATVDTLDPEEVDMFTTVIIGNSQTRLLNRAMLTPRGYMAKYERS
ncbi:MAG: precorrin-3B C(17)-methyltransferase [Desulfohalobiaceae bacterium]|nr:precorrin-3B C(17)-methyltransferase [Desulfohalobiaceae bacterium]